MTWALVTTSPSGLQMKPDPPPCAPACTSTVISLSPPTTVARSVAAAAAVMLSPPGGPLAQGDRELERRATSNQRSGECRARAVAREDGLDVVWLTQWRAIEGHHDVAQRDPGARRWAVGLDVHHDEGPIARSGGQPPPWLRQSHRLETETHVAATDAAARQQLIDDTRDRGRRHSKRELARETGSHHTAYLTGGVHQRPAREPWIEDEIHADEAVHLAAAPRAPGAADGTDHAPARAGPVADREHDVADFERGTVTDLGHRPARVGDAQHGQVGAGVAPDQAGGRRAAVGPGDFDVLVRAQGVFRGHDDARAPVHAGRGEPRAAVHGDDGAGRVLDRGGEIVREREQRLHQGPPFQ